MKPLVTADLGAATSTRRRPTLVTNHPTRLALDDGRDEEI
jgi:hypothetical protein